jgi:hypothetical protein
MVIVLMWIYYQRKIKNLNSGRLALTLSSKFAISEAEMGQN